MKKIICLLFAFLCLSALVQAQKLTIKGILVDSTAQPLEFATVMLLHARDSSLANFGRSNEKGFFELKNIEANVYILKITYVGFQNYTTLISPKEESMIDLGTIKMSAASKLLNEIVVEGEKNPVTIRQDTIEFNAGSFAVKPNGNVEDLLKKLPGVEVQRDGTVKVQGETVQQVLVEGKAFFGRDPKIATRNLPADAIEKLQVFDQKSEQAVFSGIEDGQREKTINLTLKDKNKKAFFGNAMAGLGTDNRYESKFSLNRFASKTQFSVLGMGNNINQQGFGIDEYLNFTGGSQNMGQGGRVRIQFNNDNSGGIPLNFGGQPNGIMTNWAGGMNLNHQFNPRTEINSSYFYNHIDHDINQTVLRQNFLPGGETLIFNQNSQQRNQNDNHRLNLSLNHKIDSLNSLKLTTSINYSDTRQNSQTDNQNTNTAGTLLNESETLSGSEGNSLNVNTNLLFRHRFRRAGRTLSANVLFELNHQQSDGFLAANNAYYGNTPRTELFDQRNAQDNESLRYGANLSYTEPIGRRKYLELNYAYQKQEDQVNRGVFDQVGDFEEFNDVLSIQYQNDYYYHRGGFNLRFNHKKYNFATGLSLQNASLEGQFPLLASEVKRDFTNILPNVRFNYDFSNFKRLHLEYETSVQAPSIAQLQPVIDNRDPLNLYVGNPQLRPAYNHRISADYFSFDAIHAVNFFATFNAVYSTNAIIQAQSFDSEGVRITTPRNVKENLTLNSTVNFGFPLKKLKSRINISSNTLLVEGFNFVNEQETRITQNSVGGTLRYEYALEDKLNLSLSASLNNQNTRYAFDESQNQQFLNQTYAAEANLTLPFGFHFNTVFDYLVYNSTTTRFEQVIPLWHLSISKFILKAQAGELKFTVQNLLDRNIGASQNAQINFLEQTTVQNLNRYFMLSFTYNLNKALNPTAGFSNRRGGMRIIQR
ncbi:MAG: TonB-dependent receptor [Microscillaceae bacterium]